MCVMLVVDDDELVLCSVSAILSHLGHEVIQAKNGYEATMIYNQKHELINLIIMDIVMPIMDGITAAKTIKDAHPFAKIILMSGHSDQIVPMEADAFLPKPFSSNTLFESIEHVLETA